MEASVDIAFVEAFMEASTAWKRGSFHCFHESFHGSDGSFRGSRGSFHGRDGSFHGSFHELPPKMQIAQVNLWLSPPQCHSSGHTIICIFYIHLLIDDLQNNSNRSIL